MKEALKRRLAKLNSIKLKLMIIYVSVILVVMALSGTFMLRQVRALELDRARVRLLASAEQVNTKILQPNERTRFMDSPEWDMLRDYDIQVVVLSEIGIGIAPTGFIGWRVNDRSITAAMDGQEGFSVGRVGLDLNDNERQWISFAMSVDHPDGRFIVNARMTTETMDENLTRLTWILLLTILIAVVLVPILWYFLADTLTRPIVAMSRQTRDIAAGDLSRRIPVHSGDEIGALTQSINHMAEEISHYIDQQAKLDNMRKEFVANVSHELRTPLTSIRTYTETLIDGAMTDDPATARQFMEIIDEEAKRMSLLVIDLLELSRLDSKRAGLEMDVVDLSGLIRLTIRQCQVLAEQKSQIIKLSGVEDSCFVVANATRINQVITNILSNSIKYSPEATTIHVSIRSDAHYHYVSIRDEGIGVPQESLDRIFERFYRVDKTRSRAMGGTGLGLAIAKEIMEEHGGRINASSVPGKGTTMVLHFKVYHA
jgi:signal transduction histidine kinase